MPTIISGTNGVDNIQDGVISQSDLSTAVIPLGVGQTWQNVTAQRVAGTTYSNNTGRPISVIVNFNASATAGTATVNVGGVVIFIATTAANVGVTQSASFTVPQGTNYLVTLTGGTNINTWNELRT